MKNEILTFFINNNKFMTLEVLKKQMNIKLAHAYTTIDNITVS